MKRNLYQCEGIQKEINQIKFRNNTTDRQTEETLHSYKQVTDNNIIYTKL